MINFVYSFSIYKMWFKGRRLFFIDLIDVVACLKSELQSPTGIGNFNFQRSGSLGSTAGFSCSSASSAQNTGM